MRDENVPGSLATLIVGILELLDTLVDLGLYIWVIVEDSAEFQKSTGFMVRIIMFGVYIVLAFAATILLILATLSRILLYIRKCICVGWIIFRLVSITTTIHIIVAGKWWENKTLLTTCCISMIMWTIFVGIISYYTYKLSKALEIKIAANRKKLPKRHVNVVQVQNPVAAPSRDTSSTQFPKEPWSKSQFQVIKNEHVFSTKRQLNF